MATAFNAHYQGSLRTSITHLNSQTQLRTDAPKDNNGKGESFSPTDLVASALASCMITIIAIRAKSKKIEIGHPELKFRKFMKSNPRKIEKIEVEIYFTEPISSVERTYLEAEARNCPVALSLDIGIKQVVKFIYA